MKAGRDRLGTVMMGLFIAASVSLSSQAASATDKEKRVKIVVFGTSLTARGGWQAPLQMRLTVCMDAPVDVVTVAQSGSTSDWGLANVAAVTREDPDVIVFEFYANDASLQRLTSVSHSRETIREILRVFRKDAAHARLVMQIMNPFSGLRGWMRPFVNSYIDAHVDEARAQGATIVDHRPQWKALGTQALAEAIPDGLHPRQDIAAGIIVPTLARAIGGPSC